MTNNDYISIRSTKALVRSHKAPHKMGLFEPTTQRESKDDRRAIARQLKGVSTIGSSDKLAYCIINTRYTNLTPFIELEESIKTFVDTLESIGFHVIIQMNHSLKRQEGQFRYFIHERKQKTFKQPLGEKQQPIFTMVFILGHFAQHDNAHYLLPINFPRSTNKRDVMRHAWPISWILNDLIDADVRRNGHTMVIMHACYNSLFSANGFQLFLHRGVDLSITTMLLKEDDTSNLVAMMSHLLVNDRNTHRLYFASSTTSIRHTNEDYQKKEHPLAQLNHHLHPVETYGISIQQFLTSLEKTIRHQHNILNTS
eukprot:CAMPEP_0117420300 /NCGR_PEP_ID=MMETSP0758-20121206/1664_1 /TAXON_ID=63605 /ORGANISM="Percolomonas cosmopolitus, Strain AE-1 (ATCC 50343)" /LENGTH=311 /DNA_ID=CAMNT_0005201831 /DNA_START=420 /DNA_END=1352 /DNA_ORIENTATION=+